jgi:outer membrane receptor protein involved in Fe transport
VVKDGASALYGSDAVAGVVNFITKNDFEGFDVTYQFTTDEQTNQGDTGIVSAIWGVQGDNGGIIAAMQMMDRNEINVADDYQRYGGSTLS